MNHLLTLFRDKVCALPWSQLLIFAGVALLGVGLLSERAWEWLPLKHTLEVAAIGIVAFSLARLLQFLARIRMATALALVYVLLLALFVGVIPTLATALLIAAMQAVGLLLFDNGHLDRVTVAIAGSAVLAGVAGWLLPYPVHFRLVYALLCIVLVVAARKRLVASWQDAGAAWRKTVAEEPRMAAFAVWVLGLASTGCWIPTLQFDDLAYHLGLPSQLAALGYYRMDAHSQVWALSPWLGDVVQAMAQMLAGQEARGVVDAGWLIASGVLMWKLAAAIGASAKARWLCVALLTSQPLTTILVGGMQAELPAMAIALAMALIVANADERRDARSVAAFCVLAGMLLGLKTGFVSIVFPLSGCLLWRWRTALSARGIVAAIAVVLLVCGSSYFYAWRISGNPMLPLMNELFHSPYFIAQTPYDARWHRALSWDLPWHLTFHTNRFAESGNGAAGFFLLGLIGAVPLAIASKRLRWLCLVALIAFAVTFATVHYYRYVYPAIALLLPCLVIVVFRTTSERTGQIALIALVVLNVLFQGAAGWTLGGGAVARMVAAQSTDAAAERFAPERRLIALARNENGAANILLCSPQAPFAAELAGRGFTTAWYDPELEQARIAADADVTGARWKALFSHVGARYAITSDDASAALLTALSDAQPITQIQTAQLWRLPAGVDADDLYAARDEAKKRFSMMRIAHDMP